MYLSEVENVEFSYFINKNYIAIKNDDNLKTILSKEDGYSKFTDKILSLYKEHFGTFPIDKKNVIVEIYLHVETDSVLKKIKHKKIPRFLKQKINSILAHTEIIDIGVDDKERKIIEYISKFI